jgi:hypothetical protein
MRELIKNELRLYKLSLKENLDFSEDEVKELLKNYSGGVKIINDLKNKVFLNSELTQKQKDAAKDFFVREKLSKTILSNLEPGNDLGRQVIKYGIETYVNLIKSGKKHLFKPREDLTIKVGTPSPEWVERNIKDLKEFREKLSQESLSKKFELVGGEEITLGDKIEEILTTLTTDPNAYPGFIENGEWSIVNKLDTNYTNWFRILAELDSNGNLKGNTPQEKVELFFKQFPVESMLPPQKVENLKIIEKEFGVQIPTLSHADYEILKEFNKDFLNIKKRLINSTVKGDRNEQNIKGVFKLFSGGSIREGDIYDFSSYGNRVDQVFGVDMMVYMYLPQHGEEKYWVPIQAKTEKTQANKSNLLKFNIGGIAVFPTKNPEISGGYGYLTVRNGTEKSLEDLLVYNQCRKKADIQSCKKYDK